jgi:catechol 2,3-dioxygenase-like lactoylglutathione lyase family enzyme
MSIIKIEDMAYVRFQAPDLIKMRAFLEDFGMTHAHSTPDQLFMRGHGEAPFVHMTTHGDARFVAAGFKASSLEDLHKLATAMSTSVKPAAWLGGGNYVSLTDPDGNTVEVIWGQKTEKPKPLKAEKPLNTYLKKHRISIEKNIDSGPATVIRAAHYLIEVADFERAKQWYIETLGLMISDEMIWKGEKAIGAFLRCDRGDIPTDHHTVLMIYVDGVSRYGHAAFEVEGLDDLMRGHNHLKEAKHHQHWGPGRHVIGSQVFDYWRDPWGYSLEHFTDGDMFVTADGSNKVDADFAAGIQWGQALSEK